MADNPIAVKKTFHIGDILSVTNGRLLSPRGLSGVGDILSFMTGDQAFDHQVPRFIGECAPSLREQFPDLAGICAPETLSGEEGVLAWVEEQAIIHGDTREVAPLDRADHARIDPLTEMRVAMPHAKVIVVEVPDE